MPSPHRGFTLMETIVCVSVLSILAAAALPSMTGLLERQRAIAASHALLHQLSLARTTAISKRAPVVLCPSDDGSNCAPVNDWSGGWLLFLDRDGNRRPDRADDILQASNLPTSRHLRLMSSPSRKHARYLPDGRSLGTNLTISICNPKGHLLGSVIVNNAGRTRSTRPAGPFPCPD